MSDIAAAAHLLEERGRPKLRSEHAYGCSSFIGRYGFLLCSNLNSLRSGTHILYYYILRTQCYYSSYL